MENIVSIPRSAWSATLDALTDELHSQELQLWVERAGDQKHLMGPDLFCHGVVQEPNHNVAFVFAFSPSCETEPLLIHTMSAPTFIGILRDEAGNLQTVMIRGGELETLYLMLATPGHRRLQAHLAPASCKHPNCPIAH